MASAYIFQNVFSLYAVTKYLTTNSKTKQQNKETPRLCHFST